MNTAVTNEDLECMIENDEHFLKFLNRAYLVKQALNHKDEWILRIEDKEDDTEDLYGMKRWVLLDWMEYAKRYEEFIDEMNFKADWYHVGHCVAEDTQRQIIYNHVCEVLNTYDLTSNSLKHCVNTYGSLHELDGLVSPEQLLNGCLCELKRRKESEE